MALPMDEDLYLTELKSYGEGVDWKEDTCHVNGMNISYCQTVSPSGFPKLVFIHGRGGGGATCLPYMAPLADKLQLYLPDARGYGKSHPCPFGSFTMLNMVSDAIAFIEHVSDSAPVFLIGHSMGGAVAARVAKQRPDLIKAVVLEDPPWRQMAGEHAPIDGLPPGGGPFKKFREVQELPEAEYLRQEKEEGNNHFPLPYRSNLWSARTLDRAAVEHAFANDHLEPQISEGIEGLSMPVLVTRAAHMYPEVARKVLASYPKGEEVYFPGEGLHLIHAPPTGKRWQQVVKEFLSRVQDDGS